MARIGNLTYPFPALTKRILDLDGPTVTVWGGDGRQMRDFVRHVDDCVRCVLETMDQVDVPRP
ncbi:MAG: NAD-dependent epimerase/dehydratase family protein [Geminicoccaceae bacterium]